ncbi:hypothetical protein BT69DRAFT_1335753 [Atractiella rhizophila]|nr:hypothetical protein BT69DRAFT_1335753 [Atractiella rhizophila]
MHLNLTTSAKTWHAPSPVERKLAIEARFAKDHREREQHLYQTERDLFYQTQLAAEGRHGAGLGIGRHYGRPIAGVPPLATTTGIAPILPVRRPGLPPVHGHAPGLRLPPAAVAREREREIELARERQLALSGGIGGSRMHDAAALERQRMRLSTAAVLTENRERHIAARERAVSAQAAMNAERERRLRMESLQLERKAAGLRLEEEKDHLRHQELHREAEIERANDLHREEHLAREEGRLAMEEHRLSRAASALQVERERDVIRDEALRHEAVALQHAELEADREHAMIHEERARELSHLERRASNALGLPSECPQPPKAITKPLLDHHLGSAGIADPYLRSFHNPGLLPTGRHGRLAFEDQYPIPTHHHSFPMSSTNVIPGFQVTSIISPLEIPWRVPGLDPSIHFASAMPAQRRKMLQALVTEARQLGANGLIDCQIDVLPDGELLGYATAVSVVPLAGLSLAERERDFAREVLREEEYGLYDAGYYGTADAEFELERERTQLQHGVF